MIFSLKTVFSKRKIASWYMIMPANIAKCYLCACIEEKAIEKWKKNCVKKRVLSVEKRVFSVEKRQWFSYWKLFSVKKSDLSVGKSETRVFLRQCEI